MKRQSMGVGRPIRRDAKVQEEKTVTGTEVIVTEMQMDVKRL